VAALWQSKREAWGLDECSRDGPEWQAFRHLVESTLQQEGLEGAIKREQVENGLFAATMELYWHILKERLSS
jgi:hypothetical protein